MSLVVWLPLNGNLNNQGLDGSITASQFSTDLPKVSGKIGPAYQFGDGTYDTRNRALSLNTNFLDKLKDNYSISVWINPYGDHVDYNGTILSSGDWNKECWAFGVHKNNTNVDLFIDGYNSWVGCPIPTNTWTHLVCTYDNGTCKLYKNGILIRTVTGCRGIYRSESNITCVGRATYGAGYFSFNGAIQDLRIYDHTLSYKEAKELSKGLCLHYRLDNINNLYGRNVLTNMENFPGLTGSDTASRCLRENGKYTVLTDEFTNGYNWLNGYFINPTYCTIGTHEFQFDAKTTNLQGDNKVRISIDYRDPGYELSGVYLKKEYDGEWHTYSTSVNCAVSTHRTALLAINTWNAKDTVIEYRNFKLFQKISDEADCSGFGYNGTKSSFIEVSDGSPRYDYCYEFNNGNTDSRLTSTLTSEHIGTGDFTISAWVKMNSGTIGNHETIISNKLAGAAQAGCGIYWDVGNNRLRWSTANGTNAVEINSAVDMSSFYDNWIHLVMVRNSSDTKRGYFYINGVRYELSGVPNILDVSVNRNFCIGKLQDSWYPSNIKISDVRIYATALSESDIKELYQTSASIDKNGNLHCYQLKESE